jgi:hypothetical protein
LAVRQAAVPVVTAGIRTAAKVAAVAMTIWTMISRSD